MQYGLYLPNFGTCCSSALELAKLARQAEESGWDGFFIWDHILWEKEKLRVVDPWIALTAIAMETQHIRIGPLITPPARRRPWKLARETVSLDHLSGGRLVLGVGLGNPPSVEFESFGEDCDENVRATKLDEALDVLIGLWSGEVFSYKGKYYEVTNVQFLPTPVQSPRIPVWVGGKWPNRVPFRRAARWDGVFPFRLDPENIFINPNELRQILTHIRKYKPDLSDYDVVLAGSTDTHDKMKTAQSLSSYAEEGVTWWLEDLRMWRNSEETLSARIREGPPRM